MAEKEKKGKNAELKDERYLDPTFEDYAADESNPRSVPKLIGNFIKNALKGLLHNLPLTLLILAVVFFAIYAFNIWFWAIKNDTMWVGRGLVGRSEFAPYLVGGGVYEGTPFKGVNPWDKPGYFETGRLVAPLTLGLGFLIPGIIFRIIKRGPLSPLADLVNIPSLKNHYVKEQSEKSKKRNLFRFVTSLFIATLIGFLVRNPFAIFVYMLIFLLSFGQGSESSAGQDIFVFKAADKKLYDGTKKEIPVYADGMMWLYYLGIGFGIYTLLVTIMWTLFNYAFYIRLGVSVAIAIICVFFAGQNTAKMVATAACFLFVFGIIIFIRHKKVFADDGGWSESGGNIKGLMNNSGWKKMSSSSRYPGISGDSSTLMRTLRNYQNYFKNKQRQGEPLTDTDYEMLKRINQKVRDLKDGKDVSAREVEQIRKIMGDSATGNASSDVNAPVDTPSWVEDLGTAGAETFEEVARGETPAAATVRVLTDVVTGGASEAVFTPIQAGYGMKDYVDNGGSSPLEAFGQEAGKVIINEATGFVTGKVSEKANHMLGNAKTPLFHTTSGDFHANVGGHEINVQGAFSNYRNPFNNTVTSTRATSAAGQMHFAAYNAVDKTINQVGGAMVNEAQKGATMLGEQSVHFEQSLRDSANAATNYTGGNSNSNTSSNYSEGTLREACHNSGLYNF